MQWKAQIFCCNEGAVSGVLGKNIFSADLLGHQYLFEMFKPNLPFQIVKMW